MNQYAYVNNNPLLWADPLGLQAGFADQALGYGLVGIDLIVSFTEHPYIGVGVIGAGIYVITMNPIIESLCRVQ